MGEGGYTVIEISAILESGGKSHICIDVLRALPSWFGIESSIVEYASDVREMPFIIVWGFIKEAYIVLGKLRRERFDYQVHSLFPPNSVMSF